MKKRTLGLAVFLAVMLSLGLASSAMAADPVSKSGSPYIPVELDANINDQPAVFAVTDVATDADGDGTLSLAGADYPCGYQDATHFNYYPWDVGSQETCNVLVTDGTSYASVLINITTTSGGPPPDTTAPVVTISSPTAGSSETDSVELSYSVDDASPTTCTATNDSTAISGSTVALHEGSNIITVSCTDSANNTGSASVTVTYTAPPPPPTNNAPNAAFTATGSNNLVATVNGSASSDPDAGDSIVTYVWDFGDGNVIGAAAATSHTYIYPGTYTVKLTVTDTGGLSNTATGSVKVTAPPITLTVDNAVVTEGDPGQPAVYADFVVHLSRPSKKAVHVTYATVPLTATGSDIKLVVATLEIEAGQTTGHIYVEIRADTKREAKEYFGLVWASNDLDDSCDIDALGASIGAIVDDQNG